MPRFFDPARYSEDWYIELKGEYQKLFDYIIEMCDNAGVWKPNKFDFETRTGFKVNLDSLLEKVNKGKERITVLENGRWFVPGFIKFQWFNRVSSFKLSPANPRHLNIIRALEENLIPPSKVRGLAEVWQRSKDTDKDKECSREWKVEIKNVILLMNEEANRQRKRLSGRTLSIEAEKLVDKYPDVQLDGIHKLVRMWIKNLTNDSVNV